MNQEKIGKFIAKCRKDKDLTQRDLSEKLGVSNRAVSKWENGISMPDLSIMKSLCDELDITINELFDGEKSQNKIPDDNIVATIELSNKKHTTDIIGYLIFNILGIILFIIGVFYITVDVIFPTLCLVVSVAFLIISVLKLTKNLNKYLKLIINTIYIMICLTTILLVDHFNVMDNNVKPRLYVYHEKENNYEYFISPLTSEYYFCNNNNNELTFWYFHCNKKDYISMINDCKGK